MHYKTKEKLLGATKLYVVEPEDDKVTQLKIQLSSYEYVQFDLNLPIPKKINYLSLEFGGFNYDEKIDTPIIQNSRNKTIELLKNSIGYRSNNTETINELVELLSLMKSYI